MSDKGNRKTTIPAIGECWFHAGARPPRSGEALLGEMVVYKRVLPPAGWSDRHPPRAYASVWVDRSDGRADKAMGLFSTNLDYSTDMVIIRWSEPDRVWRVSTAQDRREAQKELWRDDP
jgi:hypothetical protein